MKNRPFFAFRLFQWFLSRQVLITGTLFIAIDALVITWLQSRTDLDDQALHLGQDVALIVLGLSFVAMTVVSLLMTLRLVLPLGRLIEKTKRLRKMPFDSGEEEEEIKFTNDVPGEWFELERALNRLGRELQQKTIRLSREKTELRAVMSDISEAVLAVNRDRGILFYNPQLAVLFDIQNKPNSELTMSEILRSPDVLTAYNECLETGKAIRTVVNVTLPKERLPRIFQLAVAPLRKKHNQEIYGSVGVFHDITELKQAERIRIEFVANVSHELRTPLTSILGYLQTMRQDLTDGRYDQLEQFLKIVDGNVGRLKNLVDDLLDLSNLESGKALRIERLAVKDLTQIVLDQLPIKDHVIQLSFETEYVEADAQRLQQVLRNLLENAVKYVPKGRNIEVSWRELPDSTVTLHVRDDGPGIPEEHRSRLFERFYRIDEGRSRNMGGTGIGLAIVKHIMQRHGGSVHLQSQVGEGSEFICQFPPVDRTELDLH